MSLQSIKYSRGHLSIIDQLQLPYQESYVEVRTAEEGWHAIKKMRVRGAPAIAIVAALALATEISTLISENRLPSAAENVRDFITEKLRYLVTSRPTAVNLSDAARKLDTLSARIGSEKGSTGYNVASAFIDAAEGMLVNDLEDNQKIGHFGSAWIVKNTIRPGNEKVTVLTHCNTGWVQLFLYHWIILTSDLVVPWQLRGMGRLWA